MKERHVVTLEKLLPYMPSEKPEWVVLETPIDPSSTNDMINALTSQFLWMERTAMVPSNKSLWVDYLTKF